MSTIEKEKASEPLVLCIGMKRSGSTLQFNIARRLLELKGEARNLGFLNEPELSNYIRQHVTERRGSAILKAHSIDLKTVRAFGKDLKILHIYRDLRDVFLSCKEKWAYDPDFFIAQTVPALPLYDDLVRTGDTLVQRYETLFADIPSGIREIAGFLGVTVNDKQVEQISDAVSVSTAQRRIERFSRRERAIVIANRMKKRVPRFVLSIGKAARLNVLLRRTILPGHVQDPETLLHPDHISRRAGAPGGWRDSLEPLEIRTIEKEFEGWLKGRKYLRQ